MDNDRRALIERFWARVEIGLPECCWLWPGAEGNTNGYGRLQYRGRRWMAHRLSYELFIGPIPEEFEIDHLCRVHHCVNPAHLEPVTRLENVRRGLGHGHETRCAQGHPYDEVNTIRRPNGGNRRICRICSNRWSRDFKRLKRASRGSDIADT